MSINWVMLKDGAPVELPSEQFSFKSATRISFLLEAPNNQGKISVNSGAVALSNHRLVFVPSEPITFNVPGKGDREFKSFSVPLAKVQAPGLYTPWFGPNGWEAHVEPVKDGGLEPRNVLWKCRLTFKDGGAIEFAERFNGVQVEAINGETLPTYSEI